jgi:hypothetical protein
MIKGWGVPSKGVAPFLRVWLDWPAFYLTLDFDPSPRDPMTLMVTASELRAAFFFIADCNDESITLW